MSFSRSNFFAAGPILKPFEMLELSTVVLFSSKVVIFFSISFGFSSLTLSFFDGTLCFFELSLLFCTNTFDILFPSTKVAITSELLIVEPSGAIIFSITPSFIAVTSITTLSVSISASTSSCSIESPSFFSHDERVPSKIDSGNCGDLISSAILIFYISRAFVTISF